MTSGTDGQQGSPDEVATLRAEVARLQAELDRAHAEPTVPLPSTAAPGRARIWRPFVAGIFILLAAILAPLAVVATWAHDEVGDTDRYVETVAPLASDPAVQDAVIERITTEIFARIDIRAITQEAIDALTARGLPPRVATGLSALRTPLANGIESFVTEQVGRIIRSPQFEQAWEVANRQAHTQLVAVLTGETGGTVEVSGNAVRVNLAAVIETVKARLVDRGFTLVARIPQVNAQFTVLESADLAKAQTAFRLLDAVSRVLPFLALICLGVAVFVGRSRRRTLMVGALAIAASMVLLGLGLNLLRILYLDAVPSDLLPTDAAGAIYDQLVSFIRLNLRAVLVLFLAIAAIAWVTGPEEAPVAVRRTSSRAVNAFRSASEGAGFRTGRFGTALYAYRTPLRIAVLGIALLVYVMAAHPTGAFTLTVLVVALLVLLVVELLARAPAEEQSP
jgi:hypothetical protein